MEEEHLPLSTSHIALIYYQKWLVSCDGFNSLMLRFLSAALERNAPLSECDGSTALWCFTSLLWDQCVGVTVSVSDAQEATDTDAGEMKVTTDGTADDSKLDPVRGVLRPRWRWNGACRSREVSPKI